jgi:hypothetical protein
MNDPHVERLHFKLQTGEHLSFRTPPPLVEERDAFTIRLKDGTLTADMKGHHATEEAARRCVADFLRAWEIQTDLTQGRGSIRFMYDHADISDRNPPPVGEHRTLVAKAGVYTLDGWPCHLHVSRASYPSAPTRFAATPDVETMIMRYEMYLDGKEPLLSMANVCMTLLEGTTGATCKVKDAFCTKYAIERAVRDKLGDIVSERGGPTEARKLGGGSTNTPLTGAEKQWVEEVVKAMIRRKAEFDADPSASLQPIMLPDFIAL